MALHGKTHERRKEAMGNLARFGADSDSIRGRTFATPIPGSALHLGQFPGRGHPAEVEKLRRSLLTYVVYSYKTPIAYVTDAGEIVIPNVRYSATTTNHQTACRIYLGSATHPKGDAHA